MIIKDHKLVEVPYRHSPNQSSPIDPQYLVIHYTATQNGPATIAALCSERLNASAHLVVDMDGSVTQLVPFDKKAWHAGKSSWGDIRGLNTCSLGIEVVNPGPLKQAGDGWVDVYNRSWEGEVFHGKHKNGGPYRHWAAYTPEQYAVLEEVGELLVDAYDLQDVLGHDDISPGRKIDPGPAFPMGGYRHKLFNAVPKRQLVVERGDTRVADIPLLADDELVLEGDTLQIV